MWEIPKKEVSDLLKVKFLHPWLSLPCFLLVKIGSFGVFPLS